MRGRALVAMVTLTAFTTLVVWPRGASADNKSSEKSAPAPPAANAQPGGTAPQPNAQTESASDMPPPDPNGTAARPASTGYDPYAGTAPPGQAAKPAKKKSYWWIGLIIAGGVTLIVVMAVVLYFYVASTTYVYADRG